MKKIKRENSSVVCHDGCWEYLNNSISSSNYSKIFVLVDTETKKHCLPIFLEKTSLYEIEIITIPVGEIYKTIETSLFVWNGNNLYFIKGCLFKEDG